MSNRAICGPTGRTSVRRAVSVVRAIEGDKERIQIFQGVVIARKGGGTRGIYCPVSGSTGVGAIFTLHSPVVDKIEVLRRGKVRRAKLYYLRGLRGKAARILERRDDQNQNRA